jgi:hypothetical protein
MDEDFNEENDDVVYYIDMNKEVFNQLPSEKEVGNPKYDKLRSPWIVPFLKLIREVEGQNIKLVGRTARLNKGGLSKAAKYFSATAKCNGAKNCPVIYAFSMKARPLADKNKNCKIEVIVKNQHNHDQPRKKQLQDRINLMQQTQQVNNGGSAYAAANAIITDSVVLAGEFSFKNKFY